MEQNRPKQTDQQATNAALAALAAAGNAFALGQLWEVNKGFVRRQLWQWYEKNQTVADSAGLSFEDLVQEGYFAVDYAAKHYSAEQGSFTTYLSYALLKQIRTATCGEHTRGVITEDGRRDQMIREHYADFEAAGYFDRHPEQRPSLEPRTNPEESTPPGEV